jgi:hypothetical protein
MKARQRMNKINRAINRNAKQRTKRYKQKEIITTMPEWLNEKLSNYISRTFGVELSENQRFAIDDFFEKRLEEKEEKLVKGITKGIPIGIINGNRK